MENIWGVLSQKVYENGRQYQTVNQLQNAIEVAWDELDHQLLETPVNGMLKRCIDVIMSSGNLIRK